MVFTTTAIPSFMEVPTSLPMPNAEVLYNEGAVLAVALAWLAFFDTITLAF